MSISVSEPCKTLLTAMLEKDHKARLPLNQLLAHEWFKGDTNSTADLSRSGENQANVAANIMNIKASARMNKAIGVF